MWGYVHVRVHVLPHKSTVTDTQYVYTATALHASAVYRHRLYRTNVAARLPRFACVRPGIFTGFNGHMSGTRANCSNVQLKFHPGSEQRMLSNNGLETESGHAVLLERDKRRALELKGRCGERASVKIRGSVHAVSSRTTM